MKGASIALRYGILPIILVVVGIHFLLEDIRLFLGVVILGGGFLAYCYIAARRQFRRLGYRVFRSSADTFTYEESFGDQQLRSFDIDSPFDSRRIYLPPPATWHTTMPSWTHGRRDEIVQRIQQAIGTTKYSYEEV